MINIEQIRVGDNICLGLKVDLKPAPLLLIIGERGILACGFLNIEASEKLGIAAAVVTGVRTFEDVLNAEIKKLTTEAEKLGVRVGQKGKEALSYLV
ncbi:MAG: YunC family protein [Candidatus Jordarchaeum sp.]|uniref:YunC family protein n=1 Tax=Candidatus Jordarchaeum sp. TaxID=2823881 RepID=UPI0040496DF2